MMRHCSESLNYIFLKSFLFFVFKLNLKKKKQLRNKDKPGKGCQKRGGDKLKRKRQGSPSEVGTQVMLKAVRITKGEMIESYVYTEETDEVYMGLLVKTQNARMRGEHWEQEKQILAYTMQVQ